jgi:aspartate carbamoyltransferase catalytic subunit
MDFFNQSIISAKQFNREDVERLLNFAESIEKNKDKYANLLRGKVMATLFFEPSTRTRLSFESAMLRLGGSILGFSSDESSSVKKGETLADTIRTVSSYADIIVIRHDKDGAAKFAQKFSSVPIINAGSGAQEHPTQGLLDCLTIKALKGTLDNLNIGLIGDLKYGRTVHSLALFLSYFNSNQYFISPEQLTMQPRVLDYLMHQHTPFKETKRFHQTLELLDVIYMTRIQKERFADIEEYNKVKDAYILTPNELKLMKKDAIIMHPLPRVNEISSEVDADPRAKYFEQTYYGLMLRKALIAAILEKGILG